MTSLLHFPRRVPGEHPHTTATILCPSAKQLSLSPCPSLVTSLQEQQPTQGTQMEQTELGEGHDLPTTYWSPTSLEPQPPTSQHREAPDTSLSPSPAMPSLLRRKGLAAPMNQHLGLSFLLPAPTRSAPFLSQLPKTIATEQNHQ